jgi:transcriptional regulator of acetoin/glycerol metabolism
MKYSWPGNIRELRHVIEYAAAVSSDEVLKTHHLPESLQLHQNPAENGTLQLTNEKDRILKALHDANFRKQKAAALMGMHRVTLYRKLKKYGL